MERKIAKIRQTAEVVLVACFLVGIWLPLADSLLGFAPHLELTEKRAPAPRPAVPTTVAEVDSFPTRFGAYHDDHFGFRGSLIRTHNILKAKGLHVPPSADVVIGKDGWLYMGLEHAMDQYRAIDPMTPELLEAWRRRLEECNEYCADRGVPFLFVVAPNKTSIYPEYLPPTVRKVGKETRLEQLLAHMRARSDVPILDLRDALLEAKEHDLVYRRIDGHWNELGAFAACRRLVDELRKSFPAIPPLDEGQFERWTKIVVGGDIAQLMALPDLYEEEIVFLRSRTPLAYREVKEGLVDPSIPWQAGNEDRLMAGDRTAPICTAQDEPTRPRLVMFRDSFLSNAIPFLSIGFSRAVYYWQYYFDPEILVAENPDVVVQQVVERVLLGRRLPPSPEKIRIDFARRRRFLASDRVLFALPDAAALAPLARAPAAFTGEPLLVAPPGAARVAFHMPSPAPAADATAMLRLAIEVPAAATCAVFAVPDDAPQAAGVELARRPLSKGLEIVYVDLDALAPGLHVRVEIEGSSPPARLDFAVREVRPAAAE